MNRTSTDPSDESQQDASATQVDRVLDILEVLARSPRPQLLGEVAAAVGASKPTTHRLLATLVRRGYASQDPDAGEYRIGVRCFELGSLWAANLDLRQLAAPHLRQLNTSTQETVHLAIYDHGDAVYVDKLESPLPVIASSFVGRRCPASCVATGRVLLAYQPDRELGRVLGEPLPRFTDATITEPAALRDLLDEVRQTGVGVNHGSYRDGVGGVAVAVRDRTGIVVASVGVCLPEMRFPADRFAALRDEVAAAGHAISADLGYVEPLGVSGAANPAAAGSPQAGAVW
ncbi:MAG TPA: IclR family transcriptional regulator [Trebonia sp.]|nr:IclR family transcriptional regulator [Trebonia sp.]